jgi:uncharacterized membrane protein
MLEFSHTPDWRWLAGGGLALALLLLWSYSRATGQPGWLLRLFLLGVRGLALAAVVLCLLDPQRVEEERQAQTAQVAVLLDCSRSMGIKDEPGSRFESAQGWLRQQLEPAWAPQVKRVNFGFDGPLRPLPKLDSASPTGGVTALTDALEGLLAASGDPPLAGVILCSDGIENAGRDPLPVAKAYRRKGLPIHTLTCGTAREMQDILIENVHVKRAVPNQSPTRLGIALRAPGFANRTVPVQIRRDRDVVAHQEFKLTGASQRFEMDFTPREKGFQTYEVFIPPQPGEWLTTNNRRRFGLEVVDPTINVIYMEGTPQQSSVGIPEWKYLKDALQSDPHIKVKVLYPLPGGGGAYRFSVESDPDDGEKAYPVTHPTQGFPRTLDDLLKYDVVIHSDIKVQSFTPEQLQAMARFVEQHGGGFVMIGGNSAFGRGGYHKTILDRLIPVAMQQFADSSRMRFKMRVPPEVYEHPVVALGATREETARIWTQKLPSLHGLNRVDRSKPGAVVLAETPANGGGFGERVVLAVQDIGKGRSMAFTSDTTRTWGAEFETLWGERLNPSQPLSESNCDSRYYRAFWINAVRWLAAGKTSQTNNPVTLELAQTYTRPNQAVTATVTVRNAEGAELSGAGVSLALSEAGQTNLAIVKAVYNAAARAYTAELRPATPAGYLVKATATMNGKALGEDWQLLTCEDTDPEMSEVQARPALMAELARISGGKKLSLLKSNPADLAAIFKGAPPATATYRRTPLWDRAWLLSAIMGLLTVEWAVRRLRGLA